MSKIIIVKTERVILSFSSGKKLEFDFKITEEEDCEKAEKKNFLNQLESKMKVGEYLFYRDNLISAKFIEFVTTKEVVSL